MSFLDNLTLKDLIELPPPFIVAIAFVWLVVKHGPGVAQAIVEACRSVAKNFDASTVFMKETGPQMVREFTALQEHHVERVITKVDAAKVEVNTNVNASKVEVKDHVTSQVMTLRNDLHDKRVDQIVERISRQSNTDLSDSAQNARKG